MNGSRARLLFTSPPYYGLTNYHKDQWLRLWPLGEGSGECSTAGHAEAGIRMYAEREYRSLLREVFARCAPLLASDATVYVRTDRRRVTYEATREALQSAFPGRRIDEADRPLPPSRNQTRLFQGQDRAKKSAGEVDLILTK